MITDAELTILNLVAEGARYGHEIQDLIEKRGLREWVTIGFSSVHYLLNKLEEQHMLSSELRSEGRLPARKIYALTEAGHGVLQTAIADRLRQPRAFGTGFELALANLNVLKPAQVYRILSQHRSDLGQRLLSIEQSQQRQQKNEAIPMPEHIEALYSHSIALMEAELKWIDGFLKKWVVRYPAVLRGRPSDDTNPLPSKNDTKHHVHEVTEEEKRLQKIPRPKDKEETHEPEKRLQKMKRPKLESQEETPTATFPKNDRNGSADLDDRKIDDSNDDF
ncbi:MAG TPA: PadR family transcriptional regulator [Aggregatilineales bacterium]|nr:PadR family transcriptional regulator [Aggregatilineales bacterium]